jgi:hypothetical protein
VGAAEDHRAAGADVGGRLQLVDEAGVADPEQHQVGGGVEVGERRPARPAGHLVVRRVDRPHVREAGGAQRLSDHPVAEAAGTRAGADERDGPGVQRGREGVVQAEILSLGAAVATRSCGP